MGPNREGQVLVELILVVCFLAYVVIPNVPTLCYKFMGDPETVMQNEIALNRVKILLADDRKFSAEIEQKEREIAKLIAERKRQFRVRAETRAIEQAPYYGRLVVDQDGTVHEPER